MSVSLPPVANSCSPPSSPQPSSRCRSMRPSPARWWIWDLVSNCVLLTPVVGLVVAAAVDPSSSPSLLLDRAADWGDLAPPSLDPATVTAISIAGSSAALPAPWSLSPQGLVVIFLAVTVASSSESSVESWRVAQRMAEARDHLEWPVLLDPVTSFSSLSLHSFRGVSV
ncbi:hypothetical protein OsI_18454 [Oryza sativa Indica Group]|uniref:Uncharacterized protein n=1 Tax=Oryza sativa subsp. indica TaxID=39946 RepID=A2Y0D9_ORYSI|nr:hypothetical protein OsI_18454 [Oryza sativa Indica Group]